MPTEAWFIPVPFQHSQEKDIDFSFCLIALAGEKYAYEWVAKGEIIHGLYRAMHRESEMDFLGFIVPVDTSRLSPSFPKNPNPPEQKLSHFPGVDVFLANGIQFGGSSSTPLFISPVLLTATMAGLSDEHLVLKDDDWIGWAVIGFWSLSKYCPFLIMLSICVDPPPPPLLFMDLYCIHKSDTWLKCSVSK